jgi:hypothetical protein
MNTNGAAYSEQMDWHLAFDVALSVAFERFFKMSPPLGYLTLRAIS